MCMIERRKHRRIITLKNFGRFILVALVALAAMNIASELRAPRGNEYGRPQPVKQLSTRAPEVNVVHESDAPPTPVIPSVSEGPGAVVGGTRPDQIPRYARDDNDRIAIVGDQNGVAIVTPKHKLRGGFPPQ